MKRTLLLAGTFKWLVLLQLVLGAAMGSAIAQEVTVCPSDCDFASIGAALNDAASAGQDVVVEPGTYAEGDLTVTSRTLRSSSPENPELTIIDATGTNAAVISNASDATIRGFTITGGNSSVNGGGIRVTRGTVHLDKLIIEDNSADRGGGVSAINTILPRDSQLNIDISNSVFRNNTALTTGGGLYWRVISNDGTVTITDSEVSGNRLLGDASSGSDEAVGGGIATGSSTTLIIRNSGIEQNSLEAGQRNTGAGISSEGTTLLENVTISDNTAGTATFSVGGGVYIPLGNTTMVGGTISGNSAGDGGGVNCRPVSGPTFDVFVGSIADNTPDDITGCPTPGVAATGDTPADVQQSGNDGDPVNTFTGDLFDQYPPDIHLGGPLALHFSRYYSSALLDANVTSLLGDNWRHNYDWTLRRIGGNVEIVDKQGRLIEFSDDGSGWKLAGKTDVAYQLVEASGAFTLLDPRDQRLYSLASSGRLTGIADGRGNTQALSYDSTNRLVGVDDGLGRSLSFGYDGDGYLATVSDGSRTVTFGHTGGNLTGVTDTVGNVSAYAYDAGGLMTSTTRPEGTIPFTQTWNGSGQVATQTDADGDSFSFAYGGADTTITGPLGNTRVHTHTATGELSGHRDQASRSFTIGSDATGRRSSITDRLGDVTAYTYHEPSGQLASIAHADATSTSFSYAARVDAGLTLHDLSGIVQADGNTQSFGYDGNGNLTSHTDPAGNTQTLTYDGNGRPLTVANRAGGVTAHTYNADATRATTADPAGNTTSFGYDALRRLNQVTYADTSAVAFSYDNEDRPLSITDERSSTTTLTYDGNGNLATITDPLNNTTSFDYDGNDRLTRVADPLGGNVSYAYDELARLATLTDANGNTVALGYDALDRLTSITDAHGNVSSFSYDAEGIISSASDPLGNTTSFESDQMGRVTRISGPLGNTFDMAYDAMGRLAMTTDALGNTSAFSRDARGLLSAVSLPENIATAYARNALGQITTITDANGNDWTIGYDNQGRETGSSDPLGNGTIIAYDERNRPSTIGFPGTLGTLTVSYDAAGNPIQSAYSDSTTLSFTYDANNRLTAADGLTRSYDANGRISESNGIAVGRDAGGRITSMTLVTGKTVTYTYDGNDNLTEVADWTGASTSLSYDSADRLTTITRPNGITTTYTYDDDSRLIGIEEGSVSSIALVRDSNGQIIDATQTLPQPQAVASDSTTTLGYNAASRVADYSYDELGRRTADDRRSYTWDLASRLSSYTQGTDTVSFGYDALGRRSSRTQFGTTQNFVWNDALRLRSVSVEQRDGADHRYYVHTPDGQLLYSIEAADDSRRDYHYDEIGNTLFLSDAGASVIASYAYSPYGELLSSSGNVDNAYTWQGRFGVMREGDGLYYMRARYYDSAAGRFISRDPARLVGPREVNPYQYALANPLRFVDPTGRRSLGAEQTAELTSFNPIEAAGLFLTGVSQSSRDVMRGDKPPTELPDFFLDALSDLEGDLDRLSASEPGFVLLFDPEGDLGLLGLPTDREDIPPPPSGSGIVPFLPPPGSDLGGGFTIRDTTSIVPEFPLEQIDEELLQIFQEPKTGQPIINDSDDRGTDDDESIIPHLAGIVIIS